MEVDTPDETLVKDEADTLGDILVEIDVDTLLETL